MSSFTSLYSATEGGPGVERQLMKATAHHTMIVDVDGTPTNVAVSLEGSHDGFLWTTIAVFQATEGGIRTTAPTTHLVTYVRANLLLVTGDPSATVTVTIASADDA